MRAGLRDGDAARLREAAHRLCGMIGAFSSAAGAVASELEDVAAEGRLDGAAAMVERLDAMCRELIHRVDGVTIEALRQQAEAAHRSDRECFPDE